MIDLCLCSEAPQLPILSNFSPVCVGVCEWKREVCARVWAEQFVLARCVPYCQLPEHLGCQGKQWDAYNDACACSTFHCWPWDVTSSDCVNVRLLGSVIWLNYSTLISSCNSFHSSHFIFCFMRLSTERTLQGGHRIDFLTKLLFVLCCLPSDVWSVIKLALDMIWLKFEMIR